MQLRGTMCQAVWLYYHCSVTENYRKLFGQFVLKLASWSSQQWRYENQISSKDCQLSQLSGAIWDLITVYKKMELNFWGSSSYKVLYLNVVYFNQHYCSLNSLSCSSLAFCPSVVWSSWDLRMMFSISGGETGFFCQQWHLFPSSWSTVSILVLQQSLYQNPSDSFLALM